ncbi:endonuclease MutS2 [Ruminococcus flavefaciens]|uniref:Endonuclease MutS2 n=1 Tax=Ruminococcus flavefaciens TaxID=1265 RepID=A0A315XW18_RUMFL|nr:endonuclease MutS2 [Ruminococcus flavefaciens]PWJ11268.1 DNA mismatch repair protein MutS2 [Ruminococcus flavefaciens]SSA50830.1 DNA mismatch repair protein MutS2 [Ruminococcus flavefaciens]
MDKYLKTLELDKILDMLAELTSNEETRRMALEVRPDNDLERVRYECLKTSQAFSLSVQFGTPPFSNFKDISTVAARAASGAVISLRDLMDIAAMLRQIKALADWYSHCENVETELSYLFSRLQPNDWLLEKLERSIISDNEIADAASPELAAIRRKINRAGMQLRETLDKMIKNKTTQQYLQESNVTIRDGRFVLPVKSEYRGQVSGLVHDTSATGQTIFIEPMAIVEANNDIRILEGKEQEEIERIIRQLCRDCGDYAEILTENYKVCTELNLYFAKSNLAAKLNCSLPEITDDGKMNLKKARHPLISKSKAVPVDISLGEDYQALIITGPNTGGKTVSLKTAGLLAAMTMCGLLIPCADGSRISVYDHILADIGDSQSIEQNLSTFSSHTNKVIEILGTADERSLVLLDELGSGTDPVEGAALAISIIRRLMENGAKIMVTTHYQELKVFAIDSSGVENASCEFDIETLRPTYRLIVGSPGKSNAFAISESLGMPSDIIRDAKSRVSEANTRLEEVIGKLEASRIELERQKEEISRLRAETAAHEEAIRREREEIEAAKADELEKARLRAMTIIEQTKAESNELIDELEKLRKEKDKKDFSANVSGMKSKTKQSFNKMYDTANPVEKRDPNEGYVLPRKLRRGDTVYVVDLQRKGIISGDPDGSDFVFVQMGVMKTKMNISRLRLEEPQKVTVGSKPLRPNRKMNKIGVKAERRGKMELDIRGCACDDGVYQLDAFIDQAVMSNISTVTIIHGKGTGLLRQAVHKRLKSHPSVKSFRLGLFGEGEDGVTVAELK